MFSPVKLIRVSFHGEADAASRLILGSINQPERASVRFKPWAGNWDWSHRKSPGLPSQSLSPAPATRPQNQGV